mmetsp:Transcript_41465/g.61003  ORF Transcript_41465/g.61003 Transcript_41465/m.61003 type:complete len:210 (-) Transcript_41465:522-1151(-)
MESTNNLAAHVQNPANMRKNPAAYLSKDTISFAMPVTLAPHCATPIMIMETNPIATLIKGIHLRIVAAVFDPLHRLVSIICPVPTPPGLASSAVTPSALAPNAVCSPRPNPLPLSNSCMPANAAAAGACVASAFTTASCTFSTVSGVLPAVLVAAAAIAVPSTGTVLRALPHFEHFVATVLSSQSLVRAPNCISKLFVGAGAFCPSAAI